MAYLRKKNFIFFCLAAHGKGISGGDRIFIELARRWSKKLRVDIYLWTEGREMCRRQKLEESESKDKRVGMSYHVSTMTPWWRFGFLVNYIARIVEGIRLGLTLQLRDSSNIYIYDASEFWMDSFPCVLLKLRFPRCKWIASWYQTAPSPLIGFAEKDRASPYRFKALLYWLNQLPVRLLIKKYADKVLVNNEEERMQFPKKNKKGDVIVLIGAVPLTSIREWESKKVRLPKIYDAVFQGRFHVQKGVVELIDIWKKVVEKEPGAKLGMIGDGPLMEDVKAKILKFKLEKNIKLFGYVFDGPKKYRIFYQSKIVVHPAYYDSGGMASAEAMAFGLPCVGFSLRAYESYYPKGMLKVKDIDDFSRAILKLLNNGRLRNKIGKEAKELVYKSYSWDFRAKEILKRIV